MDKVEKILWFDPQQQPEAGRCSVCGGVIYRPGCDCARCRRDAP